MQLLIEQSSRLLQEKVGLEELCKQVPWLLSYTWGLSDKPALDVCVDATLDINGDERRVRLVYPRWFPDAPAYVLPLGADGRWSAHQYGKNGALCLEYGPDNWSPSITGAQLLISAVKLLSSETAGAAGEAVPSRHAPTIGKELLSTSARFLCTSRFLEFLLGMPDGVVAKVKTFTNSRNGDLVSAAAAAGIGELPFFDDIPSALAKPSPHNWVHGGFVISDARIALPKTVKWPDLKAHLEQLDLWPIRNEDHASVLIVHSCGVELPRVFLCSSPMSDAPFLVEHTFIAAETSSNRRNSESALALQDKKVGIVGLGSVGSKIAVSLARAGVRHFELVDDDFLFPVNLVRNQLLWDSIGFAKADEVAHAIRLVAPSAKVVTRYQRVASQENSQSAAATLDRLSGADIVIDATASSHAFLVLAEVCKRSKTPLVWGELYAGGIGAMMARSIPNIDAPASVIRAAIYQHLDTKPPAPFKQAADYGADDDENPVVADDADVSQLAASMSRYALDILQNGQDLEHDYPVYFMGYKKAWFFRGPFDTEPLVVAWDSESATVAEISADDQESRSQFILEVLTNAENTGAFEPNKED